MLTLLSPRARRSLLSRGRRGAGLVLAVAAGAVPATASGQDGWTERRVDVIDARVAIHAKLMPLAVRPTRARFRTIARWRWPHAKPIFVSIESAPLAAGQPLASLLEEMDGRPRREARADGLPALRTEVIFEGTLERRFWIHDRARGQVVRLSIAILGIDRWMQRKPADIHREFADPLWVPTKMFRTIRFGAR